MTAPVPPRVSAERVEEAVEAGAASSPGPEEPGEAITVTLPRRVAEDALIPVLAQGEEGQRRSRAWDALFAEVEAALRAAQAHPEERDGPSCERCGDEPAATCECDEETPRRATAVHDDSVHIIDLPFARTLCGQPVREGMNVTRFFGPQPTRAEGCWTCMDEREKRPQPVIPTVKETTS